MSDIHRRKVLVWLAAFFAMAGVAKADNPLRLLIIDGQNNHDWKAMTPPMKASLEATGRFLVDVATTPPAKSSKAGWNAFRPDFSKYDVVVSNYNGESWPEDVKKSLADYVKNGGGLVVVHAANNAFEDWPEWNAMIGLGWRDNKFGDRMTVNDKGEVVRTPKGQGPGAGHGPPDSYKIVTRDAEHPITRGLPAEWMHAKDELYHGQRGPAQEMHILATAYSDKSKGGTGTNEPILWVIPFGKGRVFTTVLGHVNRGDSGAIQCLGFQTTLARGAEWAATGKVTLPVPPEFPTATKDKVEPAGK